MDNKAEAERTPREKSFGINFTVITLEDAIQMMLKGKEIWSCRYGEDSVQDSEDTEDMFTTITLEDVNDLTIKELVALGPFGV